MTEGRAEMERLTQWIDENTAIPRVDLRRCGHERCTTQLARYEDTGLTPEQIRELKERDTARAPEPAPLGIDGMVCPSCGKKALPWDRFCGECGQRFWEDE